MINCCVFKAWILSAMINRSDSWGKIELTNWFLRIIRTLEKFQLWWRWKIVLRIKKNLKIVFYVSFCFACHSYMSNVSESESILCSEGKNITQTNNLSHPKKHEKKRSSSSRSPIIRHQRKVSRAHKKKLWIKNFFSAHKVSCFSFFFDMLKMFNSLIN